MNNVTECERKDGFVRPTTLFNNQETISEDRIKKLLGKPNIIQSSTTPSPGGSKTRIPISRPISLTSSPGMLRRSSSLRLRGDRFAPPGNVYFNGQDNRNSVRNFSLNTKNEQDSVKTESCSRRLLNPDSQGHHQNTVMSTRKSSGNVSQQSPAKENASEFKNGPYRQRSSLSLSCQPLSPHTPPGSPDQSFELDYEDDMDSLHSYSSMASTTSCDHPYVARNGTTFSGRKMKYVVHCSSHAGQTGEDYLTPTQRAQKHIRRLKALLHQAKLDLEQKDSDIFRLTKEVVELRLYKASLNSPEEKSTSSEAITVCENTPELSSTPPPPPVPLDMQSSCADSGHFEDLVSASPYHQRDKACSTDQEFTDHDEERRKLIDYYENKLQDLARIHGDETQELKRQHNDRVEALLKTLAEVNERYCQLMPDYETAREKIRELEKQLDDVSSQLRDNEEKQRKMYLQFYAGQSKEVALPGSVSGEISTASVASRVSVADLLHQLQATQIELENIKDVCRTADQYATSGQTLLSAKEAVSLWVLGARKAMYRRLVEARGNKNDLDPEVTLQFLKSAIYYFLTDKENHRGHLRAIESILGFSTAEISNIDKAISS